MQTNIQFNFLLNEASIFLTSDVRELEKIATNPYSSISTGTYLENTIKIEETEYKVVGINITSHKNTCVINVDVELKG